MAQSPVSGAFTISSDYLIFAKMWVMTSLWGEGWGGGTGPPDWRCRPKRLWHACDRASIRSGRGQECRRSNYPGWWFGKNLRCAPSRTSPRFLLGNLSALLLQSADMTKPPLILISPTIEEKGDEFGDFSISLSAAYPQALMGCGAIPLVFPATVSRELIAEGVSRCDGVLLTGGEDVDPRLYGKGLPPRLRGTVNVTPDGGARDLRELMLIDETFRQGKPLLAICRGHQLLNVALGGTLMADILGQMPRAINHRRMDRRNEVVHEVRLTRGSLLAKITGKQKLGVNSTHHQAVAQVAAPLKVAAVSSDGIIESLELRPGVARMLPFLLSVQFHPERLADRFPEHQAVFGAFAQACVLSRKE
jgi:putative glutamine amidotransferase